MPILTTFAVLRVNNLTFAQPHAKSFAGDENWNFPGTQKGPQAALRVLEPGYDRSEAERVDVTSLAILFSCPDVSIGAAEKFQNCPRQDDFGAGCTKATLEPHASTTAKRCADRAARRSHRRRTRKSA